MSEIKDAVGFLTAVFPTGRWVITAIEANRKESPITATFTADTADGAREFIDKWNGKRNLYWTVNQPAKDFNGKVKPGKEDIQTLCYLHADLDPQKGHAFDKERERIRDVLDALPNKLCPRPSFVIDSGGGYQAFWTLSPPVEANCDLDAAEHLARYNEQLGNVIEGDHVQNLDRIMRLPFTTNIPNEAKRNNFGREEAPALIYWWEDTTYKLEDFTPAPLEKHSDDDDDSPTPLTESKPVTINAGDVRRLSSIEELDEYGIGETTKTIILQGSHPELEAKGHSRSEWLFRVVCMCLRNAVPQELVYGIITDPRFGISASVLDAPNSHKYALRQIERGLWNVAEDGGPQLRQMNERHAVIANYGGRCIVTEEVTDEVLKRTRLTTQSFADIKNRYLHKKIEIPGKNGPVTVSLGKWWLEHAMRRQYHKVAFIPTDKDTPGVYNTWQGFTVDPAEGDWSLYRDHIERNVCNGNPEYAKYVLDWMAHAVQNPGQIGNVALVLRGKMGTGKGVFAKRFGDLWGRHFMQVVNANHLVGKFNAHLQDCAVLFADEAFYAGDVQHENVLKSLVTESTIIIEGKGKDAIVANNYIRMIMASNHDWVVPTGGFDRRFCILDVADNQRNDRAFFNQLEAQWLSGGMAACLNDLLARDLSDFRIENIPETKARRDQKRMTVLGKGTIEEWWARKLQEGILLDMKDNAGWLTQVAKKALRQDYVLYMRNMNHRVSHNELAFGHFIAKVVPNLKCVKRKAEYPVEGEDGQWHLVERTNINCYLLATIEECRAQFDAEFGSVIDWQPIAEPEPEQLPI